MLREPMHDVVVLVGAWKKDVGCQWFVAAPGVCQWPAVAALPEPSHLVGTSTAVRVEGTSTLARVVEAVEAEEMLRALAAVARQALEDH